MNGLSNRKNQFTKTFQEALRVFLKEKRVVTKNQDRKIDIDRYHRFSAPTRLIVVLQRNVFVHELQSEGALPVHQQFVDATRCVRATEKKSGTLATHAEQQMQSETEGVQIYTNSTCNRATRNRPN